MNCKPGDLAIVISAFRTPEIIGRIVEVVALTYTGARYATNLGVVPLLIREGDGPTWRVRSTSPLPWRLNMGDGSTRLAYGLDGAMRDAFLRPVSGLPLSEEVLVEVPYEQ